MTCKNCGGRMYEIVDPTYGCQCETCGIIVKLAVATNVVEWIEDRSEMEEGE